MAEKTKKRGCLAKIILLGFKIGIAAFILYAGFLSIVVWERFGSKKWELPARVYARPMELYSGLSMTPAFFEKELSLMSYRKESRIGVPGSYSLKNGVFTLHTRAFDFPDGREPSRKIRIELKGGKIRSLSDIETGEKPGVARLEPALVGSFYPKSDQDRLWVKFDDVPRLLIQTIIAVEDRDFYEHHGINPLSILRALKANIVAGKTVQGGSTLTQQLVKNLFLSREKTLRRKFDEAVMAFGLEFFYDKDRIFEAYINEVYLGQDGKRAIHGFGMASRFYFGRSLEDLRADEIALLTGLLKGPSYYDPRRRPERALKRRNHVLRVMADQKLIRPDEAEKSMKTGLGVIADPMSGVTPFPAFLDLVKRNLLEEYDEEDLGTEGLRIFSTIVPGVQFAVESSVKEGLKAMEKAKGFASDTLECAAVVTAAGSAEVAAMAGGRRPERQGFNRALDSRRPVGSLIKPAVYLAALTRPGQYTLITPLDDSPVRIETGGETWAPKNFDGKFHGKIPLFESLAFSYNAATVRLGMEIGLDRVFGVVKKLGVDGDFPEYPSALLGAVGMSPLDAARMYQTLAAGGFHSPVRAIQSVYRPDGQLLQRYPLTVRENVDPGAVYLLNRALQKVVENGTGRSLDRELVKRLYPAGKTGTTDELRDSWFAGFTGDYSAVVWVGRDDNKPCGFTGASGAMKIWGDAMAKISNVPLRLSPPENVVTASIDPSAGWRTDPDCPDSVEIPFIAGSEPKDFVPCRYMQAREKTEKPAPREKIAVKKKASVPSRIIKWFKDLF